MRVTNPSRFQQACVYAGSAAAVSYNGTQIAEGAVPSFCTGRREQREVVASLRGVVVDAPLTWLPSPAEMQRTGAVVDVAVWLMTEYYYSTSGDCRGIKIGGGCSF